MNTLISSESKTTRAGQTISDRKDTREDPHLTMNVALGSLGIATPVLIIVSPSGYFLLVACRTVEPYIIFWGYVRRTCKHHSWMGKNALYHSLYVVNWLGSCPAENKRETLRQPERVHCTPSTITYVMIIQVWTASYRRTIKKIWTDYYKIIYTFFFIVV